MFWSTQACSFPRDYHVSRHLLHIFLSWPEITPLGGSTTTNFDSKHYRKWKFLHALEFLSQEKGVFPFIKTLVAEAKNRVLFTLSMSLSISEEREGEETLFTTHVHILHTILPKKATFFDKKCRYNNWNEYEE